MTDQNSPDEEPAIEPDMASGETLDPETPAAIGENAEEEPFDAPVRAAPGDVDVDALIVNLDGYAGPLDVLLDLARSQKVDIRKISMLALVEQYLEFIEVARQRSLELAADYLVMASWLAFLKSKLLLPQPETGGEEPTADEMAARLAFQLQRLEAMRKATDALFALPRMGLDVFPRGAPEGVRVVRTPLWQADLFDLLKAYTTQRVKTVERDYKPPQPKVFSLEEARSRLSRILGSIPEWSELTSLMHDMAPDREIDAPETSVMAGAFHAALEFAKEGRIDLRQVGHFQPIFIRCKEEDSGTGQTPDDAGDTDSNITSLPGPGSEVSSVAEVTTVDERKPTPSLHDEPDIQERAV